MGKYAKLKERILSGTSDTNIDFSALCKLLVRLNFDERIKGSHHIFTNNNIIEILNLQPRGSKAKPYQVKTDKRYSGKISIRRTRCRLSMN